VASQGDQPISLVYFKEKGIDINSLDLKGSSPLHWAAYLGCENSVNFLSSWDTHLNSPDIEGGLTPLHLAVISGILD
jgi:ankyrin repeat protein